MTKAFRAALFFVALAAAGCGGSPTSDPSQVSGVAYSQTNLTVGTGRVAANGNHVSVYYTGWLYDAAGADNKGRQFDSLTSGTGLPVVLGSGGVIKGFDQGVVGMAVGGKRRLVIPQPGVWQRRRRPDPAKRDDRLRHRAGDRYRLSPRRRLSVLLAA